jgi:hypothetical protein
MQSPYTSLLTNATADISRKKKLMYLIRNPIVWNDEFGASTISCARVSSKVDLIEGFLWENASILFFLIHI